MSYLNSFSAFGEMLRIQLDSIFKLFLLFNVIIKVKTWFQNRRMKHKKVSKKAVNSSTGNTKPAYDQISREFEMNEDGQRMSKRTDMTSQSNCHSRSNSSSSQRSGMSDEESNFDCDSSEVKSSPGSRSPSRESIGRCVNNLEEFESIRDSKIQKPQSIEGNHGAFKPLFQTPDELKFYLNSQGLHSNESMLHFHDISTHKLKLFNQLCNDVRMGYTNGLVNSQSNHLFKHSPFLNNQSSVLNAQTLSSHHQDDLTCRKVNEHEIYMNNNN